MKSFIMANSDKMESKAIRNTEAALKEKKI